MLREPDGALVDQILLADNGYVAMCGAAGARVHLFTLNGLRVWSVDGGGCGISALCLSPRGGEPNGAPSRRLDAVAGAWTSAACPFTAPAGASITLEHFADDSALFELVSDGAATKLRGQAEGGGGSAFVPWARERQTRCSRRRARASRWARSC